MEPDTERRHELFQESLRGREESCGTTESLIVYVGSKGAKDKGRRRLLRAGRSRAGLLDNFWSWKNGAKAGPNPWKANTLEWQCPSPPGHGNFDPNNMPNCYRGPYEFSVPGREKDYWPQNEPA